MGVQFLKGAFPYEYEELKRATDAAMEVNNRRYDDR